MRTLPIAQPKRQYRLYDACWQMPNGDMCRAERRLPATAPFERACATFSRGTVLKTPNGPQAIEDLRPGDSVTTLTGPASIQWIGSTIMIPIMPRQTQSRLTQLVRIQTSGMGMDEMGDLVVGPLARIARPLPEARDRAAYRALDPLMAFGDGHAFAIIPPSPVRLFQIVVSSFAPVFAHGLWIETLHAPTKSQEFADDWPLLAQLSVPAAARQGNGMARLMR
ncbi:MAG: Hint domain-containing protein [Pseudomonadota bacterium]